jgi:hypothetical protein
MTNSSPTSFLVSVSSLFAGLRQYWDEFAVEEKLGLVGELPSST